MNHGVQSNAPTYLFSTFFYNSHSSHSPPPSLSLSLHFLLPLRTFTSHTTAMATNALTRTSVSMCSLFPQLNHRPAFSSISGPRSALCSSFGRRNVSFSRKPHSIRLKISCNAKPQKAKQETVDKVCEVVKKQLALADDHDVCGESKFSALGADSLDTVEIVMGLEEVFGISVEEDSAQSITTVQEAADLIEEIIQKKSC